MSDKPNLHKTIEGVAASALESNEVPYLVPRIVVGALILIATLSLAGRAEAEGFTIAEYGALVLAGLVLISWLIGYAVDAVSIASINRISPLEGNQTMIYFKSLEGYRFLVMCSLFLMGLVIALLHAFALVVAPFTQTDYKFDFSFFLIFFVAILVALTGLTYAILRRHEFDRSIKAIMGENPQTLEHEKQLEELREKLKDSEALADDRMKEVDILKSTEGLIANTIRAELAQTKKGWIGKP